MYLVTTEPYIIFRSFHIVLVALNYCQSCFYTLMDEIGTSYISLSQSASCQEVLPRPCFISGKIYIKYNVLGLAHDCFSFAVLHAEEIQSRSSPEPCGHTDPMLRPSSQDLLKNKVRQLGFDPAVSQRCVFLWRAVEYLATTCKYLNMQAPLCNTDRQVTQGGLETPKGSWKSWS